jgi:hypothetical protein
MSVGRPPDCLDAGRAGQPEAVSYWQRPVRLKKYALNAETAERPVPHRLRFAEDPPSAALEHVPAAVETGRETEPRRPVGQIALHGYAVSHLFGARRSPRGIACQISFCVDAGSVLVKSWSPRI